MTAGTSPASATATTGCFDYLEWGSRTPGTSGCQRWKAAAPTVQPLPPIRIDQIQIFPYFSGIGYCVPRREIALNKRRIEDENSIHGARRHRATGFLERTSR